jgi:hypothetical protein
VLWCFQACKRKKISTSATGTQAACLLHISAKSGVLFWSDLGKSVSVSQ